MIALTAVAHKGEHNAHDMKLETRLLKEGTFATASRKRGAIILVARQATVVMAFAAAEKSLVAMVSAVAEKSMMDAAVVTPARLAATTNAGPPRQ